MDADEKTIVLFSTRVRQLILQYNDLKEENKSLKAAVEERDFKVKSLEEELIQAKKDYNSLKMARMLAITDGDMESAQKRMSKLIRDVDKCITLISGNK